MLREVAGVAVLFCGLGIACAGSEPGHGGPGRPSRRDSAGITIVENGRAAWDDSPVWRIADTPRTVIGDAGQDGGRPLFRVMSAGTLPDGRLLVANNGTNEILVFASDGQYSGVLGGAGAGPGEFRSLLGLWVFGGDSVLAADASGVAHVFTADGEFTRQLRTESVLGSGTMPLLPRIRGVFATGQLLVAPWTATPPEWEGPYRDTLYLSVLDREGHLVHRLGRLLGREWYQVNDELRRVHFAVPMPFPRETFGVTGGPYLYVAENRRYEIQIRSPAGEVRSLVRRDYEVRPITSADMERYRDALFERNAGASERLRARLDGALADVLSRVESPEVFPAIRDLHVAVDGSIWVREYQPTSAATDWTVFGPDGAIVARTSLPDVLTPDRLTSAMHPIYEIGDDYIVGLVAGENEEELLHVYPIER